jgi:hypothetical protein
VITLVALLWAHPGHEQELIHYEDTVLALIPLHGGRVLSRVRRADSSDGPFETQVIEMPSDEAIAAYMIDPVRVALADTHARAIARTDVVRGDRVV